jgi:hypothetical protein
VEVEHPLGRHRERVGKKNHPERHDDRQIKRRVLFENSGDLVGGRWLLDRNAELVCSNFHRTWEWLAMPTLWLVKAGYDDGDVEVGREGF